METKITWHDAFEILKTCRELFLEGSVYEVYMMSVKAGILSREEMNTVLTFMPHTGIGKSWSEVNQEWDRAYTNCELHVV